MHVRNVGGPVEPSGSWRVIGATAAAAFYWCVGCLAAGCLSTEPPVGDQAGRSETVLQQSRFDSAVPDMLYETFSYVV